MAAAQAMKRIPRIRFPQRHSNSSGSESQLQQVPTAGDIGKRSEIPVATSNSTVGGKASLQPKRTPVSDKEIEAILLGGCF